MQKSFRCLLLLTLLLFQMPAHAKTMIISDIDDTIKVSRIRNKVEALRNAFRSHRAFTGAPELFQYLKKSFEDASFYYVSNAPDWLIGHSHERFLRNNNFPDGELHLRRRRQYSTDEHKIETISNLIIQNDPDQVILFGDNGENDILFYNQITQSLKVSHPHIRIVQFIHYLYEGKSVRPMLAGQIPYLTPLEVLGYLNRTHDLQMNRRQLINFAVAQASIIRLQARDEDSHLFPDWLQCSSYSPRFGHRAPLLIRNALLHIRRTCRQD